MPNKLVDNVKDPGLRAAGQAWQIIEGRKLTTREVDELSEARALAVPVAREAAKSVGRVVRANPVAVPVVLGVVLAVGAVIAWKKWGPGS